MCCLAVSWNRQSKLEEHKEASGSASVQKKKMEEYPTKNENLDDPPNSRLFLVTSRCVTEDDLREKFSAYGDVQGVWVVKDKQTKEPKGICYVKFSKSSQACLAMEEMHGSILMEGTKPIKVSPGYIHPYGDILKRLG